MLRVESALLDIRGLDVLAAQDTTIHRRDPRAKVLVTLAFLAVVVSYGKYDLTRMLPLFLYPVALVALGNLPPRYLLGKLLIASPFALVVGISNPILDRAIVAHIGSVPMTGGWISYASILLRFCLTLSAALILVSTTGFNSVCMALERLRVPKELTMLFMLLYRYLFVLLDAASRMHRAWSLRSAGAKRVSIKVAGSLVGQLLVRAIDRAQRLHMAMLSRGFDGKFRVLHPISFQRADALYVTVWCGFFVVARLYSLPQLLGHAVTGVAQ